MLPCIQELYAHFPVTQISLALHDQSMCCLQTALGCILNAGMTAAL